MGFSMDEKAKQQLEEFARRFVYATDLAFDSQLEACYVLGISGPSQIRRYRIALGYPGGDVLGSIAEAGLSTDWLHRGYGQMTNASPNASAMRQRMAMRYARTQKSIEECPEELVDLVLEEQTRMQAEEKQDEKKIKSGKKGSKAEHSR